MLDAVLVANRGEIALRVLRACRELGLRGVAIHSEADRGAPWLDAADEVHLVGPAPASQSYLAIDRILDVAARARVDAIHPGYGFLSERADAARAITEAGLVWVGPPAAALERMGDKLAARAVAQAAGAPVVAGTDEPLTDPEAAHAFVDAHGLPVAIKAAFGGGGRGLRVVHQPEDLARELDAARREAQAAFGRDEVYLERYLARPRHVEVQVLADAHGHVVALGDRDCSVQRHHQKLLEEAPAPDLPAQVREEMTAASVRIAREVGYVGAGTCEFLVEGTDCSFLEMNARLQVEHPVTELVTGVDLVRAQLRIAAGEPLPWDADDAAPGHAAPGHAVRGHAIEARINAEDPARGFAPAPGRVTRWEPPSGPGVRVDAGVASGWEVPGDYDSLLAKIIGYGATRDEALATLRRALGELRVEGVPTTTGFHLLALDHPDVRAARASTVSVEQEWDLSGLVAAEPPTPGLGPARPSRTLTVEVDGKRMEVALFEPEGAGEDLGGGAGSGAPAAPRRHGPPRGGGADEAVLPAPLQGTVVALSVAEGSAVETGQRVAMLEAMKMENEVTAHRSGVVTAVHASVGDALARGDALLTIARDQAG